VQLRQGHQVNLHGYKHADHGWVLGDRAHPRVPKEVRRVVQRREHGETGDGQRVAEDRASQGRGDHFLHEQGQCG